MESFNFQSGSSHRASFHTRGATRGYVSLLRTIPPYWRSSSDFGRACTIEGGYAAKRPFRAAVGRPSLWAWGDERWYHRRCGGSGFDRPWMGRQVYRVRESCGGHSGNEGPRLRFGTSTVSRWYRSNGMLKFLLRKMLIRYQRVATAHGFGGEGLDCRSSPKGREPLGNG